MSQNNKKSIKSLGHANIFLAGAPALFLLLGAACSPHGVPSEHPVLQAQVAITDALEHTAELECPGDSLCTAEEVAHLHRVTNQPRGQDRDTESFTGARAVVGQDLWNGESGLNGETDAAQQADVGGGVGDRGDVKNEQNSDEVGEEHPVPRTQWVSISS